MSRPTWTRVLTRARKLGVALLGVLGIAAAVAASGVLPEPLARWAPVVVALATAAGVYRVPNTGTLTSDQAADLRLMAYNRGRLDQLAAPSATARHVACPGKPPCHYTCTCTLPAGHDGDHPCQQPGEGPIDL